MTDTAPAPRTAPTPKTRWLTEARALIGVGLLVVAVQSLIAKPFYIPSESMMPTLRVGDQIVVSKYPYGWSYASPNFHLLPFLHGRLFGRLPARGDIVILSPPDPGHRGEDLIKRVIGLPGDRVALVAGRLWLNGRPVPVQDLGTRLMPIDGHFHCDANDPDPERAFPGFIGARVTVGGKPSCRLHVLRETLPGGGGRSYDTLDFGPSPEDDFAPYTVPAGHVFLLGDNRDDSADSRISLSEHGLGGAVPFEAIGGRAEFVSYSLKGEASWNPLSWLADLRRGRFGLSLRPETPAR